MVTVDIQLLSVIRDMLKVNEERSESFRKGCVVAQTPMALMPFMSPIRWDDRQQRMLSAFLKTELVWRISTVLH